MCSVKDNPQEVANNKGPRYPPGTLYGIVCSLKRHLEEVKGASTFTPLDYKDKMYFAFPYRSDQRLSLFLTTF